MLKLLRAKIHRATVTDANVSYEGSITLPPHLIAAAGFREYEAVWIWDVTNGARLETYIIAGPAGSDRICINGAAAHLIHAGDIIIIAAFTYRLEAEVHENYQPICVFMGPNNQIADIRAERVEKYR